MSVIQWRVQRWCVAACLAAALPLLWRAAEVTGELRQDRRALAAIRVGSVLQVNGRFEEAGSAFQEAIEISPKTAAAYVSLGEVEFKRGRIDEAIQAYRRLMEMYPYTYSAALYRQVGLIELRAGRVQDARTDLEQAVIIDPDDWFAHYLLGHALRRLGDTTGARKAWRRVTTLNPEFQPVREQLRSLDEQ